MKRARDVSEDDKENVNLNKKPRKESRVSQQNIKEEVIQFGSSCDEPQVVNPFNLDSLFGEVKTTLDTDLLTSSELTEELKKRKLDTSGSKLEKRCRLEKALIKKDKTLFDPKATSVKHQKLKTPSWLNKKLTVPPGWR
eukprot:TRINITY_DN7528_c0_g1_i1.p1 TRINITY_DN7528_c0_g1~~TRINITY_DN7528_c0_g1_i1.p1  ORF type:complete len:139 (+),score=30.36 TRINITY_DN7528_c0_g1_i1:3-419(+)